MKVSITKNQLIKVVQILALGMNTVIAQEDSAKNKVIKRHAVNFCPLGIALGIFSANYEYLVTPKNGILARVNYEVILKRTRVLTLNLTE